MELLHCVCQQHVWGICSNRDAKIINFSLRPMADLWKGVHKQQQTTIYCPTKLSSHPARFATPCFLNKYNVWVWPYVTLSSECSITIPIAYINLSKRSFEVSWNFRTSHLFLFHHLFHHPRPPISISKLGSLCQWSSDVKTLDLWHRLTPGDTSRLPIDGCHLLFVLKISP